MAGRAIGEALHDDLPVTSGGTWKARLVVVQFGLHIRPVKAGDPSLRLKNGSAQDDRVVRMTDLCGASCASETMADLRPPSAQSVAGSISV